MVRFVRNATKAFFINRFGSIAYWFL